MRLSRTWKAQRDLDAIWAYVAHESGSFDVAERAIQLIGKKLILLRRMPLAGRDRSNDLISGLRSIPAGQHVIFYLINKDTVRILRVLHGSQDAHAVFSNE